MPKQLYRICPKDMKRVSYPSQCCIYYISGRIRRSRIENRGNRCLEPRASIHREPVALLQNKNTHMRNTVRLTKHCLYTFNQEEYTHSNAFSIPVWHYVQCYLLLKYWLLTGKKVLWHSTRQRTYLKYQVSMCIVSRSRSDDSAVYT